MSEAFPYALGVALSPVAIASSLLLLTCRRARATGALFALGWTAAVAALAVFFAALARGVGIANSRPVWVAVLEFGLGAAFLAATAVVLFGRAQGRVRSSGFIAAVESIEPGRAAVLGVLLAGANPKVVALALGSALALSAANVGFDSTAAAVGLFAVIGAAGAVVPLVGYLIAPSTARRVFGRARLWLERHETAFVGILGTGIGAVFLVDGLSSLN